MYKVSTTRTFEKDLRRCQKRGLPIGELRKVVTLLSQTGQLPSQYHPNKLSGDMSGIWECHIKSDWLLAWEQNDAGLRLLMLRTGSHSDLFK